MTDTQVASPPCTELGEVINILKTPQPIGSHGDSSEGFMNNPCGTWRHEIFMGS